MFATATSEGTLCFSDCPSAAISWVIDSEIPHFPLFKTTTIASVFQEALSVYMTNIRDGNRWGVRVVRSSGASGASNVQKSHRVARLFP